MVENKRKKFHDKDKYYRLAKEQGLRSRAAFKLTQINRKFRILENATTIIDLCAAPGGWSQVIARALPDDATTTIVAVDILPIRSLGRNVITLIGDLTTEKCKAQIRTEMQGRGADVVLCDGAPNVGASYDRDAYDQNELALHALKCASEHLKKGGTFVTKLYRSTDYSAYLWCAKQFFATVQAVKPAASRAASAEIFLVCQDYSAPEKIDSRMFDPACVFEQLDGQATGGGDKSQTGEKAAAMNVFHKEWGKQKRNRQGYDMAGVDASFRNIGSVCDFMEGGSDKDPIQMLSDCTGLAFYCPLCKDKNKPKTEKEAKNMPTCSCQEYVNHRLTTPEVKACLSDLKVLNKNDFKGLLQWREKIRVERKAARAKAAEEAADADSDDDMDNTHANATEANSDEEDANVQTEIEALRKKKMRERKRKKKKEREIAAKRRRRAALGMDLSGGIEVPDNEKIFNLATIRSGGDLEAAREVDLENVDDEMLFPTGDSDYDTSDDEAEKAKKGKKRNKNAKKEDGESSDDDDYLSDSEDDEKEHSYRLEADLDRAYSKYLTKTRDGEAKAGTKMAKRSKKFMRQKALENAREDAEMVGEGGEPTTGPSSDTMTYARMLNDGGRGEENSGDEQSSDNDSDDGFHDDPDAEDKAKTAKKSKAKAKKTSEKGPKATETKKPTPASSSSDEEMEDAEEEEEEEEEVNPLIHTLADNEPASAKTGRWFSNPLFESIEHAARSASFAADRRRENNEENGVQDLDSDDDQGEGGPKKRRRKRGTKNGDDGDDGEKAITAEDVLASMPKTDKQVRHEKRLKTMERQERRKAKRDKAAGMGDNLNSFQVAPAIHDDVKRDKDGSVMQMDGHEKKARELIKMGMGAQSKDDSGFEVVPAGTRTGPKPPVAVADGRKYDSENEDYDSDDYARTLALGTMILRKSKERSMVDASYNRYAWNDNVDLPDWFLDDENKNYRPQIPIPQALIDKMNAKVMDLATKPIAKVAEARARKTKRAKTKMVAAKKKAEAVANSADMSEASKLKAISKAMRGRESKNPGKTYVVSKKGGGTMGGKGVKLVDRRERSDKRGIERGEKKRKHGKKGGLTGSKKRRSHS